MTDIKATLERPITPPAERRSEPRHQLKQRCIAALADSGGTGGWSCLAFNISAHGIGMLLPLPVRPGVELHIEPWALPGAPTLRAKVVHTKRLEFAWMCGCELIIPLTDAEIAAWLGKPGR